MRLTDLEPWAVAHVVRNIREADRAEVFALWPGDEDSFIAEVCANYGPFRFVAWHESVPVAIFGANLIRSGVYTAYLFATDDFPLIGLPVTRFIKRELIPVIERAGAHRCDAWSSATHFWAHRWLKALGAFPEATLRRLGRDGEDFVIFRWDNRRVHRRRGIFPPG